MVYSARAGGETRRRTPACTVSVFSHVSGPARGPPELPVDLRLAHHDDPVPIVPDWHTGRRRLGSVSQAGRRSRRAEAATTSRTLSCPPPAAGRRGLQPITHHPNPTPSFHTCAADVSSFIRRSANPVLSTRRAPPRPAPRPARPPDARPQDAAVSHPAGPAPPCAEGGPGPACEGLAPAAPPYGISACRPAPNLPAPAPRPRGPGSARAAATAPATGWPRALPSRGRRGRRGPLRSGEAMRRGRRMRGG